MSDEPTSGGTSPTPPETLLAALKPDERGLVPAVAQDALTGEVRMVAYVNREALERTLATGDAHFWSRSRGALWRKGETSGHVLRVRSVLLDCDGDCVLIQVEPDGPSCHTGAPSCFFRELDATSGGLREGARPRAFAERLEAVLAERRDAVGGAPSYTRKLLDAGPALIGAKLREEADELARALEAESDERVVSEAADVVFHTMVALAHRRITWRSVLAELARRFGTSGLDEKAARRRGS